MHRSDAQSANDARQEQHHGIAAAGDQEGPQSCDKKNGQKRQQCPLTVEGHLIIQRIAQHGDEMRAPRPYPRSEGASHPPAKRMGDVTARLVEQGERRHRADDTDQRREQNNGDVVLIRNAMV